ncbi:acyl-CoA dehydrogenase [Sphingomonas sp. DBB INV C78]|uniref:acyl-CoA dehydrogenase n=1 Tax=Sphingomonas sp. DBB INV C78 TaxID=3349434 RepID=UPI0036D238AE
MIDLQAYVGRQEFHRDFTDRQRIARLAALLDHLEILWAPDVLPPLAHWLCFLPDERQSLIGHDGHPLRSESGFLPLVDLPRRMWAGSRIRFLREVPIDSPITKTSTILAVEPKTGRSGNMLFVTVQHMIGEAGGSASIIEEQDIVYRESGAPGAAVKRPTLDYDIPDPVIRHIICDPVMVFRYSALTFNAHRIHYDLPYAREDEGYRERVVQGPLIATLLLHHALSRAEGRRIETFQFRAVSPLFVGEEMRLGLRDDDRTIALRAVGPDGVAVTAEAGFAS